ncbi:MAG: ice-binding family protein [Balneolaceae bacterium]
MNKLITQFTREKWNRFFSVPIFATLLIAMVAIGCDDDSPEGSDDPEAPEVLSTIPVDNAIDVAINSIITATFSEDMDEGSLTDSSFYLSENGVAVAGEVTLDGRTATLTPNVDLITDTEYVATITIDVQSEDNLALENNYEWSFTTSANGDTTGTDTTDAVVQDTLSLGAASQFVILTRSALTHDGDSSNIEGDIGISPGTSEDISGFVLTADTTGEFATATGVNGNIYASDYAGNTATLLTQAEEDIVAAYDSAYSDSRGEAVELSGDLNAQTLTPGLYEAESIDLAENSIIYLDAEGDAEAVFLIRVTSDLTVGSESEIMLEGDAQAQNVYWVVDGDVTFGENAMVYGNVISGGNITLESGAELEGRLLLQGEGASDINLNNNTITIPGSETTNGGV